MPPGTIRVARPLAREAGAGESRPGRATSLPRPASFGTTVPTLAPSTLTTTNGSITAAEARNRGAQARPRLALSANLSREAAFREALEVAREIALRAGGVAQLEQAGAASEQRALRPRRRQGLIDEHLKVG